VKRYPFRLPRHGDDEHDHFDLSGLRFVDHHGEPDEGLGEGLAEDDGRPLTWIFDNVELTTVGVDIGSSTSHLIFARLHLQRLSQSLSSRFAVVKREVLHRSPILLTPHRVDGLIDVEALDRFVQQSYAEAGLSPEQIDTGAVILTGVALERANSRAVAELFAGAVGKFVCASAGHNLEALLAAHGSGAVALSHLRGETLLHVDVGGGTSKLSLVQDGEVLATAAVGVGGRLVAFDEAGRVVRVEPVAARLARELGVRLELGEMLSENDRRAVVQGLAEVLLDALGGEPYEALTRELLLTAPLEGLAEALPAGLTFSGGVAEFIYGREGGSYGDLGPELAAAIRAGLDSRQLARERLERDQAGPLPHGRGSDRGPRSTTPDVELQDDGDHQLRRWPRLLPLAEGIRATVIGASQFSVQLSGNTVHIANPAVLPLRNLPVVHPRLPNGELEEGQVARAIRAAFQRLDLVEGEAPVALSISWRGEPRYATLRALAGGIASAMPRAMEAGFPLVIALQEDVGRSLGGILAEELGVRADLVAIDGLQLVELDYVDVGELLQPANVVPVVVKSLAFPGVDVARQADGEAPTPAWKLSRPACSRATSP
jgi:ethanolamine utilization protein EutA